MARAATKAEIEHVESDIARDTDARKALDFLTGKRGSCDRGTLLGLLVSIRRATDKRSLSEETVREIVELLGRIHGRLGALADWDQARFLEVYSGDDAERRLDELREQIESLRISVAKRVTLSGKKKRVYRDRKTIELVTYVESKAGSVRHRYVAPLIAVATNEYTYSTEAHREWWKRHKPS